MYIASNELASRFCAIRENLQKLMEANGFFSRRDDSRYASELVDR